MARVARLKPPPTIDRPPAEPIPGVPDAAREVGGSLNPTVDFTAKDAQVHDYIIGRFVRKRSMILDPKNPAKITMVYDIAPTCIFEGGEKPHEVSVWGAGILDLRMVDVKPGQMIAIQYVGQVKTKRGLNPAKDFTLKVWDA